MSSSNLSDCFIRDVWGILSKSYALKEKWSDLAGYLRIPTEDIEKLRLDLLHDKINRNDVLNKIIHVWVADQGSGAKLVELIRVLEDDCLDNLVGEALRLLYNLPCKNFHKDSSNWDSLSSAFQKKVEQNISKFYPNISISTVKSKLDGDILYELMRGKQPKLFNSNIPPRPKFYLDRTLLPRHTISEKIFDEDTNDIFLFTGLNEFELGRLIKKHETSTSSEQLDSTRIHVRFILLEQSNHFLEVCKRESVAVHLLSYESYFGKLKWVKTRGRINLLQRFVDKCQSPLTEGELLKSLQDKQLQTILIADSPGMEKSFLLANIAHKLELDGEKIVAFTSVNDFIKQVKFNSGHGKTKTQSIKFSLENLICKNELGSLELSNVLSASDVKIELMMDGFDEVNTLDTISALQTIKLVTTDFKSIRLWISTRPHCLEELEKELDVLGYNIKGFDEDDQVNFLKSHWQHSEVARDKHDLNLDKLTYYGRKVLQKLKRQLNKDDKDIAGIPLQCLLIGEVFEEECIGFANTGNVTKSQPKIRINSISELYTNMVAKKFLKYLSTHVTTEFRGYDDLVAAHVDLSIKLLFPSHKVNLNFIQVRMEDLHKVGILQMSNSSSGTDFIHRTFAEYFVAGYVIEQLSGKGDIENHEFIRFFIKEILVRKKYFLQILSDGIYSYKFTHDVIGYFLNANISPSYRVLPQAKMFCIENKLELETKMEIYYACADCNFLTLFKLFLSIGCPNIDKTTILLALRNSTCEYIKFIMFCLGESLASFGRQNLSNFLRVAVQRSDPQIVEFLIKTKFEFRELIENLNESTKLLLHDSVSNTRYMPGDEIEKRIGIMRRLFEINPDLLEEKDGSGRTPILCEYVHVDLLKELIRLGANTTSQDMMGDTVLHLSKSQSRRFNTHEYHSLIISLSDSKLAKILKVAANDDETPLMRLLNFIDPTRETLDILLQKETGSMDDVFCLAIKAGRVHSTFNCLIKSGVDITWKGENGESHLHSASQYGNLDALTLLVEDYSFDVNIKDNNLQTPMDYAILSRETDNKRFKTAKALYNFGGRQSRRIGSQQQFLLKQAIEDGNVHSIRILREVLMGTEVKSVSLTTRFNLSEEDFKLFVKAYVEINTIFRDLNGRSLLHLAAEMGDELAVKDLVKSYADLDNEDFYGNMLRRRFQL